MPATTLLQEAFEKASKLPEPEQNVLAKILLDELQWTKSFRASQNALEKLANEALTEFKQGKTEILDLKNL